MLTARVPLQAAGAWDRWGKEQRGAAVKMNQFNLSKLPKVPKSFPPPCACRVRVGVGALRRVQPGRVRGVAAKWRAIRRVTVLYLLPSHGIADAPCVAGADWCRGQGGFC
jgi:hypothetical protein